MFKNIFLFFGLTVSFTCFSQDENDFNIEKNEKLQEVKTINQKINNVAENKKNVEEEDFGIQTTPLGEGSVLPSGHFELIAGLGDTQVKKISPEMIKEIFEDNDLMPAEFVFISQSLIESVKLGQLLTSQKCKNHQSSEFVKDTPLLNYVVKNCTPYKNTQYSGNYQQDINSIHNLGFTKDEGRQQYIFNMPHIDINHDVSQKEFGITNGTVELSNFQVNLKNIHVKISGLQDNYSINLEGIVTYNKKAYKIQTNHPIQVMLGNVESGDFFILNNGNVTLSNKSFAVENNFEKVVYWQK